MERYYKGEVAVHALASGLTVHTVDTLDVTTGDVHAGLVEPMFHLLLILSGSLKFGFDQKRYAVEATSTSDARAVFIARSQDSHMMRGFQTGNHLRKVCITGPLHWLDAAIDDTSSSSGHLQYFMSHHLSAQQWSLGNWGMRMAEQIMKMPAHFNVEMRSLLLTARASELLSLACDAVLSKGESGRKRQDQNILRAHRIRDFLEAHLSQPLTLDNIARQTGVSVSNMQRLFKNVYGVTVFEYIRVRRLALARDALRFEGKTVTEAAYIAGYSSASNFATAFKLEFGVSPGRIS